LKTKRIYLSQTGCLAKNLSRNLIAIRLNRSLSRRPSAETLVEKGVLPGECRAGWVAAEVVGARKRLERERVKDGLRRWVSEWRARGLRERREEGRVGVRFLVRRFAREGDGRAGTCEGREIPPRAKVLGLRRFWEGVGKDDFAA
jgi:hypothetical protein